MSIIHVACSAKARLRGWTPGNFEGRTFYSDSLNDLPLLQKVRCPVAANPDDTLRAHAERHGWEIINLRG